MTSGKTRSMSFGSRTPISRNPSPTMPGGPTQKRTTRSSNATLTQTEIEALPNTVVDAASAHQYLKKKSLCHATEPYTLMHLISVLLQITQISGTTPLPVITAIRSVAFLLKQHAADEITEMVAKQVTESVTSKLVDHVVAAIAPQIARILTATETLEGTLEKTEQIRTSLELSNQNTAPLTPLTPSSPQILEHIKNALAPQIETLTATSNSLTQSLEEATKLQHLIDARVDLDRDINAAADRITNTTDTLYSAIEDCQNSIDLISPSLATTQTCLNTLSNQLTSQPIQPSQLLHPPVASKRTLFSDIVTADPTNPSITTRPTNNQTPYPPRTQTSIPPIDMALARSAIRARQILLDPVPGNLIFTPNLSHEDTLSKIRSAIQIIRNPGNGNDQADVKALLQLRNGGLIVELDSEETLIRLRDTTNRRKFLQALNFSVIFKDRTYTLVVQYIPVNMLIERPGLLRLIEGKNHLKEGSLVSMRWIKPPHKRPPGQMMAFALLQVNDATMANKLIKEGIYIDQHLVRVKKDRKEPTRCAKCQRFGHIARNCDASKDTCGTCAASHRTDECNAYRTYRCVSCRNDDHASWSRVCPEFGRRCEELSAKYPENSLPYFPTCEDWTHATLPPKATPYARTATIPPPNTETAPPRLRQTTLTSAITTAKSKPATRSPAQSKTTVTPTINRSPYSRLPKNPNKFATLQTNDNNNNDSDIDNNDNNDNTNEDNSRDEYENNDPTHHLDTMEDDLSTSTSTPSTPTSKTPTPTSTPLWFPPSSPIAHA